MNDLISVTNGNLRVAFHPLGAAIYAIYFNDEIMTTSPQSVDDFLKDFIYHGKTIGPFCGRAKNGIIIIDGEKFRYSQNEGNNTLHGGKDGLSTKIFDYTLKSDGVIFEYKDDKNEFLVSYTLCDDNSLLVDFNVKSKVRNPIALTNHSYFCLGEKSIDDLVLTIPANKFIEVDKEDMIPLKEKEIIPCLDFNNGKMIKKDINDDYLQNSRTKGYDHSFIFNNEPLVVLSSHKYRLSITTSFEAVQVYSDNYNEGVKMINSDELIHRGIAIEPQDNQLKRKIYDGVYHRYIKYHFEKK